MSCNRVKSKCDGKIAGLYDLEDTVGRGHYAVVKVARHVFTGEKVAVKVMVTFCTKIFFAKIQV